MATCCVCDFSADEDDAPVKVGTYGGYISMLSCDRCSASVCSIDAEHGPVSGYYANKWLTLCPECMRSVNEDAKAQWDNEYGDSEMENPYDDDETRP